MSRSLRKAYEITDAKIQFVSLVDKAANKRQFLLKKEDGGKATFTTYGRIIKADAENHYVTGIVYEPMEEDSHGNYMTEEEITKAALAIHVCTTVAPSSGSKLCCRSTLSPFLANQNAALVISSSVIKLP